MPFIALVLAASLIIANVADGTSRAVNASTPNPKQTSSEKAQNMKIKINIGGKTLIAILADNATARDFASVLPLTVSMAYWSPAKQFAVYYHQDGESIPSPGIIPIAKIDAGTEVFNVPGSVKVMIEIAK